VIAKDGAAKDGCHRQQHYVARRPLVTQRIDPINRERDDGYRIGMAPTDGRDAEQDQDKQRQRDGALGLGNLCTSLQAA
jgi:hypothetical protein